MCEIAECDLGCRVASEERRLRMRRARRRAIAGTHPAQYAQRDGAGCDADRLGDAGKVSGRHCSSQDKRNGGSARSEEHTSELQSLMRISYAVFCLKTKHNKT